MSRDGCLRDVAGVHGTYRKVSETVPAIEMIGEYLKEAEVVGAVWLLDRPVSNSGRLKTLIGQLSQASGWDWEVRLLYNPDKELKETEMIVASSDSNVIDGCGRWVNLAGEIIREKLPEAWVIKLKRSWP